MAEIIARERGGGTEQWQQREAAILQARKEQKLAGLKKLKDMHPGMKWNPKQKAWVPTQPRKRRRKV